MSTIQSLTHYFTTPKPSFHYDFSIFDGWFGIPFQDSLHTTPIRVPHPLEVKKKNFNIYFTSSLYFPTNWTKVKKRSNLDVFI